jgi:hypothetical protein
MPRNDADIDVCPREVVRALVHLGPIAPQFPASTAAADVKRRGKHPADHPLSSVLLSDSVVVQLRRLLKELFRLHMMQRPVLTHQGLCGQLLRSI